MNIQQFNSQAYNYLQQCHPSINWEELSLKTKQNPYAGTQFYLHTNIQNSVALGQLWMVQVSGFYYWPRGAVKTEISVNPENEMFHIWAV